MIKDLINGQFLNNLSFLAINLYENPMSVLGPAINACFVENIHFNYTTKNNYFKEAKC